MIPFTYCARPISVTGSESKVRYWWTIRIARITFYRLIRVSCSIKRNALVVIPNIVALFNGCVGKPKMKIVTAFIESPTPKDQVIKTSI
jgi:hypothetical protein